MSLRLLLLGHAGVQRRFRLIYFCLQIASIQFGDQIAGIHSLIVADINLDYIARDFRAYLNDVAVDESIIGRFMRSRISPVPHAKQYRQQQYERRADEKCRTAVERTLANVFVFVG